ncbi:MAG TPA: hypothetical protein VEC06_09125 [Paucimonas sp.]|nr:hypothetical protein [Paucimonas sp.]
MPISPISASNAAVTATQAVRPAQDTGRPERVNSKPAPDAGNPTVYQSGPPKPTVNDAGQVTGTIINITA